MTDVVCISSNCITEWWKSTGRCIPIPLVGVGSHPTSALLRRSQNNPLASWRHYAESQHWSHPSAGRWRKISMWPPSDRSFVSFQTGWRRRFDVACSSTICCSRCHCLTTGESAAVERRSEPHRRPLPRTLLWQRRRRELLPETPTTMMVLLDSRRRRHQRRCSCSSLTTDRNNYMKQSSNHSLTN